MGKSTKSRKKIELKSKKSYSKDKTKSKSSTKQKMNPSALENMNLDQNPIYIVEATDNFEALLSKVKKANMKRKLSGKLREP